MKLWTDGSLHVQLAGAIRPATPASLRVFRDGQLLRAAAPVGGESVDVDLVGRRVVVCQPGALSDKPSRARVYDLDTLARLADDDAGDTRAIAVVGPSRRARLVGSRGRGYGLVVEGAGQAVTHPLAFGGVERDVGTGKAKTLEAAEPMREPRLTHTAWGLAVGDGTTGRAAVLREGGLEPLPWRFPAGDTTELSVRATESGHLVVARRAGRESTVWHVTDDEARLLVENGHGACAAGVGQDVAMVHSDGEVIAFRLSTGEALARTRVQGVLAGVAGAAGCLVLGTASGVLEVRWTGASLEARALIAHRRHDVAGRFPAKVEQEVVAGLMKGVASRVGTAPVDGGFVVTLQGVDGTLVEQAKARLTEAGALSVEVTDSPP